MMWYKHLVGCSVRIKLKVCRCRHLIEFMTVCEYGRSRSVDLGPRPFTYENLNMLFSETTWPFLTIFCTLTVTYMEMKMY